MNIGKVYLVGAGCGDYDLITLRGQNCLKKCDVIVYDSLTDKLLLEYADNAEKICVGKRAGKHSEKQENINEILIAKANEGKTVVRLKGGDPLAEAEKRCRHFKVTIFLMKLSPVFPRQ